MKAPGRSSRPIAALLALGAALPFQASGQTSTVVDRERAEFAAWLLQSPLSPRRAVVVRPIGPGLTLGPVDTDIPLEGITRGTLAERAGRVTLQQGGETLGLPRGRAVPRGSWQLLASGPPGRAAVTVYARAARAGRPAEWFPYDPTMVFIVALTPPARPATALVLGADGVEVEATEAGAVSVAVAGITRNLRVLRMPGASSEESELEIYFQDRSNAAGSYPSGRFVTLIPKPGGGYILDLNRARNPFCAYNTVFPCPAPWRGNALPVRVDAGERYAENQ